MENISNQSSVIAVVGHTFDIMLESMVNSTGYAWCLKSMPEGVALISTDEIPVRPGIAPVRQIFTFAALSPLKEGNLTFDLLCLFDLSRPVVDTVNYTVYIHAENENDSLVNELGVGKFLKGAGAMMHQKPVMPYGFPEAGKVHLMYGFPPAQLYGFPVPDSSCAANVIHSNNNCLLKYGSPFGVSSDEEGCTLKYGFPISQANYKYGFPLTNSEGEIQVEEDAANCVVKYGTPGGIGTGDDCVLKYGFPSVKYGFPSNK